MVDELMQDMIRLLRLGGKPKKMRVSLMKDHSSLSKAFFMSIFKIMFAYLPFILAK